MNKVPMTVAGEAALREELEHLKKVERPRIIQEIAEARAHGDLRENAEYHAARERQGFIEGRINPRRRHPALGHPSPVVSEGLQLGKSERVWELGQSVITDRCKGRVRHCGDSQ